MTRPLFALALALGTSVAPARADAPRAAHEAPALTKLAPTAHTLHLERTRELEQRLTELARTLPNVEQATVLLTLADESELPLDRPLPSARADVRLVTRGSTVSPARIAALFRTVVPALDADRVEVHVTPAPAPVAPAPRAWVGPFAVEPSAAPWLRLALGGSLLCNVLLALLVLAKSRRGRPRQPKVDRGGHRLSPP